MATGRIGVTPVLRTRWSKLPTTGTTVLSGLDDNSVALVYDAGYEAVYRNGVLLSRGNDYTATNGTTITLIDATLAGDVVEVLANDLVPLTDAISKGQYNAKGALLSATAASTPAVLAVGTNDQVLTADSSTATGLKWAAAAASGAAGIYLTKPTSGSTFYVRSGNSAVTGSTLTGSLATVSRTYYVPIMVSTVTASKIAIQTDSGFTGTGITMRLGIYNNDATLNIPTTVLLDAGQVTVNSTSTAYEITISQSLPAGLYWLAAKINAYTSGVNTYQGSPITAAGYSPLGAWNSTASGVFNGASASGYYEDQASGVLATVGTLTRNNAAAILIAIGY